MNVSPIENMEIGQQADWKFGLVTRTIIRYAEDGFEINDLSDGWKAADCNLDEIKRVLSGEIGLDELEWY